MANPDKFSLTRRLVAEGLGTALLVATVVGSGIMAEQLSAGNAAIALLGNTLATGAILVVLIFVFGQVSGAHFNPVVSLSFSIQGKLSWKEFLIFTTVQITGAVMGTVLAHIMFGLPLIQSSSHIRTGAGIWIAEMVASFGLLATILGCMRTEPKAVPYVVGLFIVAAYWFTSSTSFANPAVTIARALTDTFSGIMLGDVPAFILAQIAGAWIATVLVKWLWAGKI